jgi:hypothetical protein
MGKDAPITKNGTNVLTKRFMIAPNVGRFARLDTLFTCIGVTAARRGRNAISPKDVSVGATQLRGCGWFDLIVEDSS